MGTALTNLSPGRPIALQDKPDPPYHKASERRQKPHRLKAETRHTLNKTLHNNNAQASLIAPGNGV